jgi:hypothetical protein
MRKGVIEIVERQRPEEIRDLNRTIYLVVAEESKPTLIGLRDHGICISRESHTHRSLALRASWPMGLEAKR